MIDLKEKDKQNGDFTMLPINGTKENEDKQDPWAKYGNLVKRDNIANEDGVINLMADNLLYDYSTGGVVLVDPSLLQNMTEVTKQNVASMPNAKQIGREESNNSHLIIAQTNNYNNIIRDKHDAIAKTVAQNSKNKFSPDKSKETLSPAKDKYDGRDIWNGYIGAVNKVNTIAKPIEGIEAYNDSAMAYNKKNIQNGNIQDKLITKDDLVKFTKEIDNTTIYNTVKKVSTLPIGKTLTAVDITNTCNVIVDDWVKNGTLTKESGKEIMSFFATNIGIKAVAYCTVALYGTSNIKIQTKEEQMKTALKCAAIVMVVSSLVDTGIEKSVDELVDLMVSEDTNKLLQELAENNWNGYKQEQEKMLILKEKQKTKEKEIEKLKEIGRKQVMEYQDNKLNEIENKLQEKGKENYKNMPKENKEQIEYYNNYMQGILNN